MNRRIKQLNTLLNFKKDLLQQKLIQFQVEQQNYTSARYKYQQLSIYRSEYVNKVNSLGNQSILAETIQKYFKFIAQLDCAISDQIKQVSNANKKKMDAYAVYIEAKRAVESIEKVLECAIREQEGAVNKLQQKENDEYSQNQWYSNKYKDE